MTQDAPAFVPAAPEREVRFLGGATIDGAPVAYVIVMATVVTTLAFVPFSVVLSTGGSFPMSQGVFPLLGWLLGPIAGAVAGTIGALLGVFLAPHTAGIPLVTLLGAAMGALAAGAMRRGWPLVVVLASLSLWAFVGRALSVNGVHLRPAVAGSVVDWSAIILYALPTRGLCLRWLGDARLSRVAAGVALGTWMSAGIAHVVQSSITYYMFNWPEEVWRMLVPIIPLENLARCLIGAVIGTGVISGLRAIGLVKPQGAVY